jgi:hypothetical protein
MFKVAVQVSGLPCVPSGQSSRRETAEVGPGFKNKMTRTTPVRSNATPYLAFLSRTD